MKDKFLVRFYILLIITFFIFYYFGEERTRKFERERFVVCNTKGRDIWVKNCDHKSGWTLLF
nr:MAG: hypothetical protein [Caudoviricetes sp.]